MPSITFWTRLEPFTRLTDIDAGLQARTHDPLWLLARQWQAGEFQGEDAGTPVQARFRFERAPLTRFRPGPDGAGSVPYRTDVPLEALAEREPVQRAGDPRRDLRVAAEAGLYFLRLLDRFGASRDARGAFLTDGRFALAAAPDDPVGDGDRAGRRYLGVMAGRVPDGFRLYRALARTLRPKNGRPPRLPARLALPAADRPKVREAGTAFLRWFEGRYSLAAGDMGSASAPPAWVSERMEYSFAVSARTTAGEVGLVAPEYPGGALEWHSFDLDPGLRLGAAATDAAPEDATRTVVPAPVRYPGMPADRWWEFEDGRVNLSRIDGDPDELLRLLLVEFGLVYANDWFVMPVDAEPGALLRPRSLVVTDAFGERTLVPHYTASARAHPDWRLFALGPSRAAAPLAAPADALFLPPVLATRLHGDPLEEVVFLRDELSNLVWAVERNVAGLSGGTLDRNLLYARSRPQPAPPPAEPGPEATQYRLATTVPDYWIPFQPQRIDPARPDVRLRRAAALLDEGGRPGFSRPLGRMLEPDRDLALFEEEVPRAGLRLIRRFEYTRWVDGRTFVWIARSKGAGAGEGSSGLRFDILDEP